MIRPVDMQLSLWRVEEAAHRRNPEAAPAQALQDEEINEERRLRDQRVEGSPSAEGKRVGDENRDRKEGQPRKGSSSPKKRSDNDEEPPRSEGGLDLMA